MQLERIKSKCLDSGGYLMFAAYLTEQKDHENRPIIEFQYRRYHYSLEDAKNSLVKLRQFIDDEIKKLVEDTAE